LDHKSWYIFKLNKDYIRIDDLVLFGCMGPPGGGRTFITPRIIRNFNILTYVELDESVIVTIFEKIVGAYFKTFSQSVKETVDPLIKATLKLFDAVKTDLLPIPSKSHYLFNLRDISKVFMGVCSAHPKFIQDKDMMIRLWYHESLRVFHDRLTTDDDRLYLKNKLAEMFPEMDTTAEIIINSERIIFADFLQGREGERFYNQAASMKDFVGKLEFFQEDYNSEATSGKKMMKLVLFLDACEHIARISRILRQPSGHGLLLGVGGSGRQSLTKLAVYISNHKLFQIEVVKGYNMPKWREDVKKLVYSAIVDNRPITFLFVDTQIINEQMVEDINCLLNSAWIVGLPMNVDELKKIDDIGKMECNKKSLPANKINVYTMQVARVKINTHIVFAMSPLGEVFFDRLRMFPSFVNCCTIDWFTEWPEEALLGVGEGSLIDLEDELDIKGLIPKLIQMFKHIHKSVERVTVRYRAELRRHNYVTPTSFLEQLNLFRIFLGVKNEENGAAGARLKNGIEKLKQANRDVEALQEKLTKEEPILKQTEEDVKIMLVRLSKDRELADEAKQMVEKEETIAKIAEGEATEIATMVSGEVEAANSELEKTLEKISLLTQAN
jgi:dynein heavy chain